MCKSVLSKVCMQRCDHSLTQMQESDNIRELDKTKNWCLQNFSYCNPTLEQKLDHSVGYTWRQWKDSGLKKCWVAYELRIMFSYYVLIYE